MKWGFLLLLCGFFAVPAAHAHVGSKDIYEDVTAGPYKLFITIRPPLVIPATATVEVRSAGAPINSLEITPIPMTGEGVQFAPKPDTLSRSTADKNFYTGSFWLMRTGSWRLRIQIAGEAGTLLTAVPVPAMALSVSTMHRNTGTLLVVLGSFLLLSLVAIVVAGVRESRLKPGFVPVPELWRRSVVAGATGLLCAFVFLLIGDRWWNASAAASMRDVYHPIALHPTLHGDQLDLRMELQGKAEGRSLSDFILDHGHLMHLYAIREPQMDVVYHLHPDQVAAGDFHLALPAMPPGNYALYGDVVHASGFPETLVARIDVPAGITGRPLAGDDAEGTPQPLSNGLLGTSYRFPDGYTMVWDRPQTLTANTAYQFRFHLLDASGNPAPDMQPYMGMSGHAAFVKTDGTVFAHVHPEGSASMAAMMLANETAPETMQTASASTNNAMDSMTGMAGMDNMQAKAVSSIVEFPYGFPTPGRYRVFIQMKHARTVETGVFDTIVK